MPHTLSPLRLIVPEHPRNLAALRISVTALLLISPETYAGPAIASLPSELRFAPEGLHWLMSALPVTPGFARALQWVLVASSVSGLVGLFSRTSLAVAAISGVYVLGLYQLTGSVTHDMHLLWFAALCAAGPSGEAISIDRFLARRRGVASPMPSERVAVPLSFARLLLGLVYFFPGFWKLAESGIGWITSDNLRNQMYWKWYENGAIPPVRVDRWGALLHAGALGVVLLELSFPFLVLFPRTRFVAVIGGFSFHMLSQIFLFIPFTSLWGCYTMLIDWSRFGRAGTPASNDGGAETVSLRPFDRQTGVSAALGVALVALVVVQGARNQMQAWRFACYPTFQWRLGDTIPDLALEAVNGSGATRMLPDGPGGGGSRSPDGWARAWSIAGLYSGRAPSEAALRAYLEHARQKPGMDEGLVGATSVRVYRAWYSVLPDDARRPPVRAELIGEVAVP